MQKIIPISLLFLSVIICSSCGHKSKFVQTVDFKKDSVIEMDVLKDLMVEVFLIEASVYQIQVEGRDIQYYSNSYYDDFFTKHQISRKRLLKTIEYYTARKEMDVVMQDVVSRLMEIDIRAAQEKGLSNEEEILQEPQVPEWIEQITKD